jgi:hypothetical protein
VTEPDPTAELVRAMLARRAAVPVPASLLDRTMHEVVLTRRRAHGPAGGRPARLVAVVVGAVAVVAVAMVALFGGAAGTGSIQPAAVSQPTTPATLEPAASPTDPGAASAPSSTAPTASSAPGDSPGQAALRPGVTAIVTAAGDGLRVRTAPGVGQDYTKLSPLLPAGTRMQVLLGPVEADGYDWYEISTDVDPGSGWVAAGRDGVAWIVAVAP